MDDLIGDGRGLMVLKYRSCGINAKWRQPGAQIKKGAEVGIFRFCRSGIVVEVEMSRIEVDVDSVGVSRLAGLMSVAVRMTMGRANGGGDIVGRKVGGKGRGG